jgi:thiol-disulfide isomerase/thioredoxin
MTIKKTTVKFYYADWCGHCQQFKGEWAKLKEILKDNDMEWEEYESSKFPQKMEEEKIQGYPTIIIQKKDGTKIEYSGPRTAEAIMEFIKNDNNKSGGEYKQCGGSINGFSYRNNKDQKFQIKYFKYKAKYMKTKLD